jgi:2-keto-4-pentenoate hydratase/2-oxohepta-3-ene-1,7-dioic acid hydratase in catechol pathway
MPYKLVGFRAGQGPRAGVLLGETVYDVGPGDTVKLRIEGIGELIHTMAR